MDNQKDFFIKEKLQKDRVISQKADDVFNSFFKGDFNMNQNEEIKSENSNEIKENTKVKSNKKLKKLLATAASFFVIFGAANVYAMTQGYDNIFFMIKYLTTGDQSVITDKNEILSDSDMSISYEPIKITSDIRLQIKNLQIKDNEAKLFLVVNEDNYENNKNIVPLNYKVYNSEGTLLCSQASSKTLNDEYDNIMYTEELVLKDLKKSDKIINLEIYKVDSKLITKVKIDLENRTIEVEGENEALKKVSEIELKQFLGYPMLVRNFQSGEIMNDDWKIWTAIITANNMGYDIDVKEFKNLNVEQYYNTPYGYKLDDINLILDSVYGMKIENFEYNPENDFFIYEENGEKYFVTAYAGGLPGPVECIDITDISYCGGVYTVTYTYCNLGEYATVFDVDINDYDIYEQTITFELNDIEEYMEVSKFRMLSSEKPIIIKSAEEKEEGKIEDEVVIPNDNPTTSNKDQEIIEEYFEGIWYGYLSGNVLTINKNMTFTVDFNGEVVDSGIIELKKYDDNEIPHIIFKYDNGNIYDYRRVVTGEVSLQSRDYEEVYEGRTKLEDDSSNSTEIEVPDNKEENETKVDNYASTMSWTDYWAPGIRIKYPTIFNLEEIGGYYRGNRQGEISTLISGVATGINPDTKEIINSYMTIEIYEPLYKTMTVEEIEELEKMCKVTLADGTVWYENYEPDENEGGIYTHTSYSIDSNNPTYSAWEHKIVFKTDVVSNYKVINIINWFLKSTDFTSY